jgi:hypothetical protein
MSIEAPTGRSAPPAAAGPSGRPVTPSARTAPPGSAEPSPSPTLSPSTKRVVTAAAATAEVELVRAGARPPMAAAAKRLSLLTVLAVMAAALWWPSRPAAAFPPPARLPAVTAATLDARYAATARQIEAARMVAERAGDRSLARALARLSRPGRRFLAFDPRGGGRAVEVVGDLVRARTVAVLVPGSGHDLTTFDGGASRPYDSPGGGARALYAQLRYARSPRPPIPVTGTAARPPAHRPAHPSASPPTRPLAHSPVSPPEHSPEHAPARRPAPGQEEPAFAVIAWLGYAPPDLRGSAIMTGDRAAAAAPLLRRLLADVGRVSADGTGTARISLLCHSYGSIVCARAARGLPSGRLAELVAYGSPGMGVRTAAEIGTRARVWAGRGDADWIRHVPHTRVFGFGHGADPVAPGFGARVFDAGPVRHGEYHAPGSRALRNLAEIVLGHGA